MKYAFVARHVGELAVRVLCHALEVSVSSYYAWRRRAPSAHTQADRALGTQVQTAFVAGCRVYGSPRMHAVLRA